MNKSGICLSIVTEQKDQHVQDFKTESFFLGRLKVLKFLVIVSFSKSKWTEKGDCCFTPKKFFVCFVVE